MRPERRRRLFLLGVVLLSIGALWRVVVVERERHRLARAYQQAQQVVRQLEVERTALQGELGETRRTVEVQQADLQGLRGQLEDATRQLDQTVAEIASLQRAHELLRQENLSLTEQVTLAQLQRERLEAKLTSLADLRQTIRDVKRKAWADRLAAWRARAPSVRDDPAQKLLASDNRGYVVRNGVSTLVPGVRLHVHVLEPQAQ